MTKIRCTLPNASEEMNGIKFAAHAEGGMVSVDAVPDHLAEIFLSVPGFIADAKAPEDDPEELARKEAEALRLKEEKTANAKAAKEKKDAEKAAAKAAAKAPPAPAAETPPVDPATAAAEKTEGQDTTKAAEDGKPEGEE